MIDNNAENKTLFVIKNLINFHKIKFIKLIN